MFLSATSIETMISWLFTMVIISLGILELVHNAAREQKYTKTIFKNNRILLFSGKRNIVTFVNVVFSVLSLSSSTMYMSKDPQTNFCSDQAAT